MSFREKSFLVVGITRPRIQWGTAASLLRVKGGRGVRLTTRLQLVLVLGMSAALDTQNTPPLRVAGFYTCSPVPIVCSFGNTCDTCRRLQGVQLKSGPILTL